MNKDRSTASSGSYELILEEHAKPVRVGYGYNPYDTFPNVRQPGLGQRQADLRRLSEWIRTRRQVADLKKPQEEAK